MKGEAGENRVLKSLKSTGAKVKKSPGSRTKTDVYAEWDSGREWFIQVKSSRKEPAGLSSNEKKGLIGKASKFNATAVLAEVQPRKIKYVSAKTGRRLSPKK